ncbi:MAG TPA: response regulator transcription factor [Kiritimatiellia bacterium]|nr:response regulator transcription factor [Kiritimatiellia bacterium]
MTTTQPITCKVMVVDDHAIVRHGLAMLLKAEPGITLVAEAGSIPEALSLLETATPDLLLIDITLKEENGLDLVRAIKRDHPHLKSIILSMHDEADYAERAIRAGAMGYVMKEHADDVVIEAIRSVLNNRVYLSPEISSRLLLGMSGDDPARTKPETGIESLTERELEVFEGIGRGLSSKDIADQLALSARTVEVHRANIKRKLECENAAQVVRSAVRWVEQNR